MIPETVMAMPTRELRAYLRTLPKEQADEIRRARKLVSLRRYRARHLSKEKARQAAWFARKMERLRDDPAQLAEHRAKDAERKRVERAAQRRTS